MANQRESDLLLDNVSTRRDPASTSVRHKVISRCLLEAYCQACRICRRSESPDEVQLAHINRNQVSEDHDALIKMCRHAVSRVIMLCVVKMS